MVRLNDRKPCPLRTLICREYISSDRVLSNHSWRILRDLIASEHVAAPQRIKSFTTVKSCSRIIYTDGYLLFKDPKESNYLNVYSLNGINGQPCKLRKISLSGKLKDQDFGLGPGSRDTSHPVLLAAGFSVTLYYLTEKWLHSLNMERQTVVETLPLPSGNKFTALSIDDETGLLAISSVKNTDSQCDVLMLFRIYDRNPYLVFKQTVEIKRSVFGSAITGAEISQGILIALYRKSTIKLFSLAAVCEQTITAPPVLMEISSYDHLMAIGSNPYHVIRASHHHSFRVIKVGSRQLLHGSVEGSSEYSSLNCALSFHPDESPRLIFTDNGTLQLFTIDTPVDGTQEATISPGVVHSLRAPMDSLNSPLLTTTASGRAVKRRQTSTARFCDDETVLVGWDYEQDLNLVGILYAHLDESKRRPKLKLTLDLIDSPSFRRIKRIELNHQLSVSHLEDVEVFFKFDADVCFVSLALQNNVHCEAYRLKPFDEILPQQAKSF